MGRARHTVNTVAPPLESPSASRIKGVVTAKPGRGVSRDTVYCGKKARVPLRGSGPFPSKCPTSQACHPFCLMGQGVRESAWERAAVPGRPRFTSRGPRC